MLNTQRVVKSLLSLAVMASVCFASISSTQAQFTNFNFGNQVGGIRVNANGVVGPAPLLDSTLKQQAVRDLESASLNSDSSVRKLSLKTLNQIVRDARQNNQPIPAEARYLAGMMRIEKVVVDHVHNDIILLGPAEQLHVTESGHVVGKDSGNPALRLEDLMVALQTSEAATTGQGVSVSIEPSNEGRLAFEQVVATAQQSGAAAGALVNTLEREMGNQNVILTGVAKDTRFANVLALADYKMKRISMGLDKAPLKSLPSFLEMLTRSTNLNALTPRFWMEMNYQPVTHSEDKSVWQINGVGVKTLTENDVINADGSSQATGKENPLASKWAKSMTKQYEKLMAVEPIFGELRNLFDMAVVAALLDKEGMLAKVDLELDALTVSDKSLHQWSTPSQVPTTASVVAARRGNIVAASGGVQLDPWTVVSNTKIDQELGAISEAVIAANDSKLFWD